MQYLHHSFNFCHIGPTNNAIFAPMIQYSQRCRLHIATIFKNAFFLFATQIPNMLQNGGASLVVTVAGVFSEQNLPKIHRPYAPGYCHEYTHSHPPLPPTSIPPLKKATICENDRKPYPCPLLAAAVRNRSADLKDTSGQETL